jgi:hypothetical protein
MLKMQKYIAETLPESCQSWVRSMQQAAICYVLFNRQKA